MAWFLSPEMFLICFCFFCVPVAIVNLGFFLWRNCREYLTFFIGSCLCHQKEVIGNFSEILSAKTGCGQNFGGQKPYMNNIRQSAHGICFVLILIIALYMNKQIPLISGHGKMGPKHKWALLVRNCSKSRSQSLCTGELQCF